ncbi:MAG: hypothetical protein HWE20_09635 [Gammaproteobacteria bacterium]|nr:hypothetical protein [Gammaproteobacteria bacterium]
MHTLFVDGIRNDRPSGGRTCTDLYLASIGDECIYYKQALSIGRKVPLVVLMNLPGAVFSLVNSKYPTIALEFFTRFSFGVFFRVVLAAFKTRARVVYLNHHSVYYFLPFFKLFKCKVIVIAHDSLTVKSRLGCNNFLSGKITSTLERYFLSNADEIFTFSYDDYSFYLECGFNVTKILPVVERPVLERSLVKSSNFRFGLIGNWYRRENKDGAVAFFQEFIERWRLVGDDNIKFVLAGVGSETFFRDYLLPIDPDKVSACVELFGSYRSIDDLRLSGVVAPILSGGGIKLKTLESLTVGLPVFGTEQAYTGLPPECRLGNPFMARDIGELVSLIGVHSQSDSFNRAFCSKDILSAYWRFIDSNRDFG